MREPDPDELPLLVRCRMCGRQVPDDEVDEEGYCDQCSPTSAGP